jgi:hypothetical protein
MMRAMRIPKTLIPEVVSQVVMFLNISGMKAFAMNSKFQMPKSLPEVGRQSSRFGI